MHTPVIIKPTQQHGSMCNMHTVQNVMHFYYSENDDHDSTKNSFDDDPFIIVVL